MNHPSPREGVNLFVSCHEPVSPSCAIGSVYWHSSRSEIPAHAVGLRGGLWRSTPFPVRHPLYRAHLSKTQQWYVSYLVFMHGAPTYGTSPFSSPPQKLLFKSSSRGLKYLARHYWRPADKLQKVRRLHHAEISRGLCYWMANALVFSDAKHRPHGAIGSEVEGVGNATTGSITDKLTREHRMTLDEAHLILNTKRGEAVERILQVRPSELRPSLLRANLFMTRITNTCLKPTRRRKRHRQMHQVDGAARRYLGIHTTCSQRWCGHESGSRQNWRWQGKSRQQRQVRVRV